MLWGYELVRYLIAANSVLPQNARDGDDALFEFVDPQTLNEKAAEEENAESQDNIENTSEEKNGDINNEAIIR